MKVGKYVRDDSVRPFLISHSGNGLDWQTLDNPHVPQPVRTLVGMALCSSTDADFLAALPALEEYFLKEPDYLHTVNPDVGVDLLKGVLPPPVRPRSFICVGLNYVDHAREAKMELPSRPLLFAKTANAIAGHGHHVRRPAGSQQLDYEAELAVIIGKRCHRVLAANALDYVAGYCCVNDISARDFQFADGQWYRGKSCDGFGPLGPYLVTKSEIPDSRGLAIRCRLNGTTVQDSTTANLYFGVPELVEFISSYFTLEPGDVIATGTPPGVGFVRKPPIFLQDGDVVEVDIENVGVLRNTILSEGQQS
jgi:2-keto-4-pentenoate hydratase/2-oxohepta-3-ene-1,7-dioic acid hydratase in catechol pathway